MAIKDMPTGGGGFFSPEKNADAVAILFEVIDFRRQVPGGKFGPKDTAYCDITVFDSADALAAGIPSSVMKRSAVQQTILARDLGEEIGAGNETIVTVVKVDFKNGGSGWVFRSTSQDAKKAVIAYMDKRDAELAEAIANAPDFD